MTTIDRTAYPRFQRRYSTDELRDEFSLLPDDRRFIGKAARGDKGRLTLAVMLTCRQRFGWFPRLRRVPSQVVIHMAGQLGLKDPAALLDETKRKKTLADYREAIRGHIGGKTFDEACVRHVASILRTAAETMSDPADLIALSVLSAPRSIGIFSQAWLMRSPRKPSPPWMISLLCHYPSGPRRSTD